MSGVNRLIKAGDPSGTSALQSALRKGVVDPKTKIEVKRKAGDASKYAGKK